MRLTAPEAQLQRWLLRRLGAPFKVPDLSEFGMHFMGGQILPYKQDNAVALLLYGDDKGGRVTIYKGRGARRPAPAFGSTRRYECLLLG